MCTVPCRSLLTPSYYHSFGMTDDYFVFIEQPLKLDILKMATAYLRRVSWASCMKFHPEDSVRMNPFRSLSARLDMRLSAGQCYSLLHLPNLFFHHLCSSDPDSPYWPKDKEGSWDQILHGCDGCLPSSQCLWRWWPCCFWCDLLWWQQLVWYVLPGQAEGADGSRYYVLQAKVQKICVAP